MSLKGQKKGSKLEQNGQWTRSPHVAHWEHTYPKKLKIWAAFRGLGSTFQKKNEYKCFSSFPKSPEKVKVEIKVPMHIYIILAIRWYHLQSWNSKNQYSYGCHKVAPVTEMYIIGNSFYVLKRSKKGQSWNQRDSGHVRHLGCPLRTYIPKKLKIWAALRGLGITFQKKKLLVQVILPLPKKSRKGQGRNKRSYAHLHYIS